MLTDGSLAYPCPNLPERVPIHENQSDYLGHMTVFRSVHCLILIDSKVCLVFLLDQELYIGDSSSMVIQSYTGGYICPICPSSVIM